MIVIILFVLFNGDITIGVRSSINGSYAADANLYDWLLPQDKTIGFSTTQDEEESVNTHNELRRNEGAADMLKMVKHFPTLKK